MVTEIFSLSREEIDMLYLTSTHFNIQYNKAVKYNGVFTRIEGVVGRKHSKEVWSLVTNMARMLKVGATGISIPRTFSAYRDNKQGLSHHKMCCTLDKLETEGYLHYFRGGLDRMDKDKRLPSVYKPTDKMLALWAGVDVSKEKDPLNVVQIKDRLTKEQISLKGKAGVAAITAFLERYNKALANTKIVLDGVLLPQQSYVRIFSDSIGCGGRYYNSSGGVQTIQSESRRRLVINGNDTTEIDFCGLHINLLYEVLTQGTKKVYDVGDPYSLDTSLFCVDNSLVEDFKEHHNVTQHKPLRNLVKYVLLTSINAMSLSAAYKSVVGEWVKQSALGIEGRFFGLVPNVKNGSTFPAKALCEAVQAAHMPIKDAFFSDTGVVLQYKDSEVMTKVLTSLLDDGIIGLSMHDSVLVEKQHKDRAWRAMREAYVSVVGSSHYLSLEEKQ